MLPGMYAELLQTLETALVRRNPGIAAAFKPGLPPDSIRQQLKRAGTTGNVDPIVELYSWHDGANGPASKAVHQLGFAPPTVSDPPMKNIEFLRSLGHKIDANFKVYGTFVFFDFDALVRWIKLW